MQVHKFQSMSIFMLENVNKRMLYVKLAGKKKVGDGKLLSKILPGVDVQNIFITKYNLSIL